MSIYNAEEANKLIQKAYNEAIKAVVDLVNEKNLTQSTLYYTSVVEMEKVLQKANLLHKIDGAVSKDFAKLEAQAKALLDNLGLKASDLSVPTDIHRTWKSFAKANVRIGNRALENEIAKAILKYQYLPDENKALSQIIEAAAKAGKKYEQYAQTYFETAYRNFENNAKLDLGKNLKVKKWLYVGPKDKKNRPFCEAHVDREYTTEEVDKMVNDFGQPAKYYRGGWNCRHEWEPVV
jgi:hypothetical protein